MKKEKQFGDNEKNKRRIFCYSSRGVGMLGVRKMK